MIYTSGGGTATALNFFQKIVEQYAYYAQILLGPELTSYVDRTILGFFFFVLTIIVFYNVIEELLDLALSNTPHGERLNKTKGAFAVLITLLAVFSAGFFKMMFTFGLMIALLGIGFVIYNISYGLLTLAPGFLKKYTPWVSFFMASGFIGWFIYGNIAVNIQRVMPPTLGGGISLDWVEILQWVVIGILFLHALRDYSRIVRELGEHIGSGISRVGAWFRGAIEEFQREEREIEQEEAMLERTESEAERLERDLEQVEREIERKQYVPERLIQRIENEINKFLRDLGIDIMLAKRRLLDASEPMLKGAIGAYLKKLGKNEKEIEAEIKRLYPHLSVLKQILEKIEYGNVTEDDLRKIRESIKELRSLVKDLKKFGEQLKELEQLL